MYRAASTVRRRGWRRSALAIAAVAATFLAPSALAAPPADNGGGLEGTLMTTSLSPSFVPAGAPVTVTASAPALAGDELDLDEYLANGWTRVSYTLVPSSGLVTFHVRKWQPGSYDFRVMWPEFGGTASPNTLLTGATHTLVVTTEGFGDPRAYSLATYRGKPVRWNPCRVITYRVNAAGAPSTAAGDLTEAVRRVEQATGLSLRNVGSTREIYGANGFHWDADIDIAWATSSDTPVLQGSSEAAVGGAPAGTVRHGQAVAIHGFVVLNRDAVAQLPAGFGAGATQGLVLLHELGHVFGLRHVNAVDQVMQPTPQPDMRASLYGAGDLAGLAKVGAQGGCI